MEQKSPTGLQSRCKVCRRLQALVASQRYRKRHPERVRAAHELSYSKHKDNYLAKQNEHARDRYATDPAFRQRALERSRAQAAQRRAAKQQAKQPPARVINGGEF